MQTAFEKPPPLCVQTWLNTDAPLSLSALQGNVVAVFVFQMLCPGCVQYAIPQAQRVNAWFSHHGVTVIGLHSVFEHHEAMKAVSLKAFLHEYQITFPVAIDMPSDKSGYPIPKTMEAYQLNGTPSLILIDRKGYLRKHKMGQEPDLLLGAELMSLILDTD